MDAASLISQLSQRDTLPVDGDWPVSERARWLPALAIAIGIIYGADEDRNDPRHGAGPRVSGLGGNEHEPDHCFPDSRLRPRGCCVGRMDQCLLCGTFQVVAVIIALSLKMANAWQKFVILRAGKLQSVKGPGLFMIIPVLDNVVAVIDERIQTAAFNAEQALTRTPSPSMWTRLFLARS
jgi:hypothetical protein